VLLGTSLEPLVGANDGGYGGQGGRGMIIRNVEGDLGESVTNCD